LLAASVALGRKLAVTRDLREGNRLVCFYDGDYKDQDCGTLSFVVVSVLFSVFVG